MQVLILYYSKGGNTLKLAERIGEGVESVSGVKALSKSTQEVKKEDFVDSAGVIAGSPVYFGAMAWDLKRIFDEYVAIRKKMENKVGARLSHVRRCIRWKRDHNDFYRPMFTHLRDDCGGRPDGGNRSHGVPRVGVPDEKISENGRKLGRRVAELCKRLGS
jgi:NAD(P)H dehydrogenase (quinone)